MYQREQCRRLRRRRWPLGLEEVASQERRDVPLLVVRYHELEQVHASLLTLPLGGRGHEVAHDDRRPVLQVGLRWQLPLDGILLIGDGEDAGHSDAWVSIVAVALEQAKRRGGRMPR